METQEGFAPDREPWDLAGAMGRMMRSLARRAAVGDLEALAELVKLERALSDAIDVGGRAAHEEAGYSWAQIGDELGVSRQAAQQRFGAQS